MGPGKIQHYWLVRGRDGSCEVVICFLVWMFVFLFLAPSWILCLFPFFCRSILFNPEGSCLYSGSENTLRVYGWEPDRCFDVVHVGWGKVSDLAISNNQMVCTFIHNLFLILHTDASVNCTILWACVPLAFWDDYMNLFGGRGPSWPFPLWSLKTCTGAIWPETLWETLLEESFKRHFNCFYRSCVSWIDCGVLQSK